VERHPDTRTVGQTLAHIAVGTGFQSYVHINKIDDLTKVKQVQDGKWIVVWPKEFAPPGARLLP